MPTADWLARRICQYLRELREGAEPWILTGTEAGTGPDNEPLLVDVTPIAWLDRRLLVQAHERYHRRLHAGRETHPS